MSAVMHALIGYGTFSLLTDLLRTRFQCPMRYRLNAWKSPNRLQTHRPTTTTTTQLSIDLIDPCMGMKRFTSQSNTPTAMSAKTTSISGKGCSFRAIEADRSCGWEIPIRRTWPRGSLQPGLVYFASATALV